MFYLHIRAAVCSMMIFCNFTQDDKNQVFLMALDGYVAIVAFLCQEYNNSKLIQTASFPLIQKFIPFPSTSSPSAGDAVLSLRNYRRLLQILHAIVGKECFQQTILAYGNNKAIIVLNQEDVRPVIKMAQDRPLRIPPRTYQSYILHFNPITNSFIEPKSNLPGEFILTYYGWKFSSHAGQNLDSLVRQCSILHLKFGRVLGWIIILKSKYRRIMNKQNLFVITNGRTKLSIDKSFNKPKSTDNLVASTQQVRQIKKNKQSQNSPSKKNPPVFNQDSKMKHSTHQRSNTKTSNKFPMKLRILSRPADGDEKSRSKQHNTPKRTGFDLELRGVLQGALTLELLQNDLIYKTHANQFIIKPQVFTSVVEKIILTCINNKQPESNEGQLDCLSPVLRKLRSLVALTSAETKRVNNSLCKTVQINNVNSKYFHGIKIIETELEHLHAEKMDLIEELRGLNSQKQTISLYNQQKREEIEDRNRQLIEILKKTEEMRQDEAYLRREVQKFQTVFSKCQEDYDRIVNYVAMQTKNKHVQQASVAYKNIESEIYEYAVYLQANELATSETYESIPFKNQCFVINNLEKSMKEVNKEIVHNEDLSLSQKQNLMRNFVLQVSEQYKKKDEQYKKLLDFKTKCIRKFVEMMQLWLDNWTLKQEYLVNLRKEFALDNQAFLDELDRFFNEKICTHCCSTTKLQYHSLLDRYRAIEENYKMGNSFY